jgi:hypothetical protein
MAALLKDKSPWQWWFLRDDPPGDRHECVFRLSRHDFIHGKDRTTRSPQRCLETTGGQHRVIVEL